MAKLDAMLGGLGGVIPMAMEKGGGSAMLGLIPAALDYNAKDKDKEGWIHHPCPRNIATFSLPI